MLTTVHIIGIILTVGLLLAVSWLSGRKVKDAKTFTAGGTSGSWMVCGALMGTLMGGQCTVGTAQLAFNFGLSAWWFTIGAALGAVVLAIFYAAPIRRSGCSTLLEIVARQYGHKAETVGSLLFLIGIFISIVAQVITSSAMLGSLFHLPMLWAALVGAVLIMLLVLFGGIKSAGAAGIIKLVLLYFSSLAAGIVVWRMAGSPAGVVGSIDSVYALPGIAEENGIADIESIHHRYGSLFGRGVLKNLGGCLSIVLGVVTTQTYAQSIWSAATTPKAKRGALYCAFLIPLIGGACTLVGMYMRGHYVTAAELTALQAAGGSLPDGVGVIENSAQAFPAFILQHMPAWIGGIMLGTLLINILGRHHSGARRGAEYPIQIQEHPIAALHTCPDAPFHRGHPAPCCRSGQSVPRCVHQRPGLPVSWLAGSGSCLPAQLCPVAAQSVPSPCRTTLYGHWHSDHAVSQIPLSAGRPRLLWPCRLRNSDL